MWGHHWRAWRDGAASGFRGGGRISIIKPGVYIVPGFEDVMQKNFGDVLTSEQINDLIAFLMTLTSGVEPG